MRIGLFRIVFMLFSLSMLSSCAKISLSGPNNSTVTPAGGPVQTGSDSQPALTGEWEFDYEYKGNEYVSSVQLAQQGNSFSGQGVDQDGREWSLENGEIQGQSVKFAKKYANSSAQPVSYIGELKYLQNPDFKGWLMEGTYTCMDSTGQMVSGKWVSSPNAAEQPAGNSDNVAQTQPAGDSQPPVPRPAPPERGGDFRPEDISGHYEVGYQYNFKKIKSRMWLENDGSQVSGRGYDLVEKKSVDKKTKAQKTQTVRDEFVIEKGYYSYPNVTLIRLYKDNRKITFKAKLSSNGQEINMKGETQFGGAWDARNISVVPGRR